MNILLLPPRFSRLYCRETLVAALTLAPAAPAGAVAAGLIAGAYATVATDLFTCGALLLARVKGYPPKKKKKK